MGPTWFLGRFNRTRMAPCFCSLLFFLRVFVLALMYTIRAGKCAIGWRRRCCKGEGREISRPEAPNSPWQHQGIQGNFAAEVFGARS